MRRIPTAALLRRSALSLTRVAAIAGRQPAVASRFASTTATPSPASAASSVPRNEGQTVPATSLQVSCSCGSVTVEGRGNSSINFVCHCSICRKATGLNSLASVGFKADQLVIHNEAGLRKDTPPNSKNQRYYCAKCGDYLAEDATRSLGILALPLHRAKGPVNDIYKPNHHLFYAFRVEDATDGLPKWETLPDGKLVADQRTNSSLDVKAGTSGGGDSKTGGAVHSETHGRWDPVKGWLRKDVQPLSPTRAPESKVYHFTETDPIPNHVSLITPEKVQERVQRKYYASPGTYAAPARNKYDAIVIGGGHNGLISAAYLAKAGMKPLVLERRHVVGGAAVTEELYPGFKFSRASYLAGLLRPQIIKDLNLHKYGFKYLPRRPSSFTPTPLDSPYQGKYLLLGDNFENDTASIRQFSAKDAEAFVEYEDFLGRVRELVSPLLDMPPINLDEGTLNQKWETVKRLLKLGGLAYKYRRDLVPFYELFTGPASHILDRYFESEILKTTLATDAVIGASCSPKHAGSAYVLLHHVMGEAAGRKGVWSYVQGGMGAVSNAIAACAKEHGAEIATNATVKRILYQPNAGKKGRAKVRGVEMLDGSIIEADVVLSNATPYHTFLELLPGLARDSGFQEESPLPKDFAHHIRFADYSCGALKINCAVDRLPNFSCYPNDPSGKPGPQHRGTIHFEYRMEEIENAQREAAMGIPATRPVIEMTIPSSLDTTISPEGKHVVQLFVQFAPYDVDPKCGSWADPEFKNAFADRVFRVVDEFCPGFSSSVLYRDILSPLDLERIFGLHRGNIMHGALSLHQLYWARPAFGFSNHRTPVDNLYLCGAGAHPGGGVMGAAGRNAAMVVMGDKAKL